MMVFQGITRGMLRRADDPCGIFFQLRVARPVPLAQKITDPRPPILMIDEGMLSKKVARRQALFCRLDEAIFADVVYDRQEVK